LEEAEFQTGPLSLLTQVLEACTEVETNSSNFVLCSPLSLLVCKES
jgi:hypothetical protein